MTASKSNQYLKLMGIDTYIARIETPVVPIPTQPAQVNETPISLNEKTIQKTVEPVEEHVAVAPEPAQVNTTYDVSTSSLVPDMHWLKGPSTNGLVVVFSSDGSQLETEQRALLSNMLKAIQYQPQQTGYAIIGAPGADTDVQPEGIKGILVLGKQAGDAMVLKAGARKVAGEDYFQLLDIPVVVTLHPAEIEQTPALKSRAWSDLKLLARLLSV